MADAVDIGQSPEEIAAATKLQAIKRGSDSRQAVQTRRAAEAQAAADAEAAKEEAAKARLGAGAKGYMRRKEAKKEAAASARLGAGAKGYIRRKEAREQAKASARMQANFRGRKERLDPNSETNVRKTRSLNDPTYRAEAYMKDHKLIELFELLGQSLVAARPENPRAFLIDELTNLKKTPVPSSPMNFFSPQDVDTLFSMYDVAGDGLTREQCSEALTALGIEGVALPPSKERFDMNAFQALLAN